MGRKDSVCDSFPAELNTPRMKKRRETLSVKSGRKGIVKDELVEATSLESHDGKISLPFCKGDSTNDTANNLDPAADRLVKIELDAAQALAEFSRIVHIPSADLPSPDRQWQEKAPSLHWSEKRKRSTRIYRNATMLKCNVSLLRHGPSMHSATVAQINDHSLLHEEALVEKVNTLDLSLILETDEQESQSWPAESSKGSIPPDSRAESPSSPLPLSQSDSKSFLAGEAVAHSAFQRAVPLRPIKKSLLHPVKPKIKDIGFGVDSSNSNSSATLEVKRKPRFCKHISPSKLVETVEINLPAVSLPQSSEALCKELNFRSVRQAGALMGDRGTEVLLKPTPPPLKVESRHNGHQLGNRLKPVLTELEKEARRLRRVQANRESARQTIHRKQILCEELAQKAAALKLENANMNKEKDLLLQEFHALSERNRQLKEQLVLQVGGELGHPLPSPSTTLPSQPFSLPLMQVPMMPYGGVPLPPFMWMFTLAQASASSNAPMQQNCNGTADMGYTSLEYGNNLMPGQWIQASGKSQPSLSPCASFIAQLAQFSTSCTAEQPSYIDSLLSPCSQLLTSMEQRGVAVTPDEDLVPSAGVALHKAKEGSDTSFAQTDMREDQVGFDNVSCSGPLSAAMLKGQTNEVEVPKSVVLSIERQLGSATSEQLCCCLDHPTQLLKVPSPLGITSDGTRAGGFHEVLPQTCLFPGKKTTAAAAAAAEARRRRKELTKGKILHTRTFRLPC